MLNVLAASGTMPSRRTFLRFAAAGAALADWPRRLAQAAPQRRGARSLIFIHLCGGPSQLDMWDPKPDAPAEIRGPIGSIATSVPGLRLGDLLPRVARHADKLCLVRSLTHDSTDHSYGNAYTLLGQRPANPRDYYISRQDPPAVGAVLHKLQGDCGLVPPWVVLPRPFTTFSPPYKGQSAGFLGAAFDPVMMNEPKDDSLAAKDLRIDTLSLGDGMNLERLAARRRLRAALPADGIANTAMLDSQYEQAFALLSDPACRRAFDLTLEPDRLRERYGRNEYGQSFLLARRLVESGVRVVNVFWTYFGRGGCQFNLWDNHGVSDDKSCTGGARTGLEMIRHPYCCPSFDLAFSALLEDLDSRGLLGQTLVAVAGEFGRTPKINALAGRDHWPFCYTQVLAGGGVRGGQTYGASDRHAAYVKDLPVTPSDFVATLLHAFGVEPHALVHDTLRRPLPVTTGTPLTRIFA